MRLLLPGSIITLLLLFGSLLRQSTVAQIAQPPAASFHHVHLNSTDPARAIDFYLRQFAVTRKSNLAGFDGISSERMHLLFTKVQKPPAVSPDSAIWHFGWGSTDMDADYKRHLANGITFHTPITSLRRGLVFAYMNAPDGAIVEINTAANRAFTHVHLYSDAPFCAADWYVKHLGANRAGNREGPCEVPFGPKTEPLGVIRYPVTSVRFGEISLIIYPRQRPGPLVGTRGHVVDHIAFSVPDLDATMTRLQASGIKVLNQRLRFGATGRSALIEGPDSIAIELVEIK